MPGLPQEIRLSDLQAARLRCVQLERDLAAAMLRNAALEERIAHEEIARATGITGSFRLDLHRGVLIRSSP